MDLNGILAQLGAGSKKTVHLSVTPGVGLELIQLDTEDHSVKNYAYRPLQYNDSLREIAEMEAFKTAVIELFEETKINLKNCNIVLNLPMVLFGNKELPLLLGDEAVNEALISEVEQSYIFRRYEPMIGWFDASTPQSGDMRKLFYSAIQKNAIDEIQAVFTELGAKLVDIQVSLVSLLKALSYSGLIAEHAKENNIWNLMLITQNGYSIISMVGSNIVDYYEEPLAIKSFEGDEIYNAINASAQITLMTYPANSLFIVSETNLVSAELLADRIQGVSNISYFENNEFKKNDAIPVSLEILEESSKKISLEAIGVAAPVNMPFSLNFLNSSDAEVDDPNQPVHIVIGEKEYDISPNYARNIALIAVAILLLPFLIAFVVVPSIADKKQAELDDLNARLESVNSEIKKIEEERNGSNGFNPAQEIRNVLANNRTKLIGYTALGEAVTKNLWITYFVTSDDGKFDIKGESQNVEDVYTFYRNMKDSLLNTKLRIHKLQMKVDSVDEAITIDPNDGSDYEFEITNMSDSELKPKEDKKEKKDKK